MNNQYWIIESEDRTNLDFSKIAGYWSWESTPKSVDGSLFMIKNIEDENIDYLIPITKKWGPFTNEDIEYIMLEPTWRRNIYIT